MYSHIVVLYAVMFDRWIGLILDLFFDPFDKISHFISCNVADLNRSVCVCIERIRDCYLFHVLIRMDLTYK